MVRIGAGGTGETGTTGGGDTDDTDSGGGGGTGPGGGRNIGDIEEQQEQPGGSEEVADEPTGGDDGGGGESGVGGGTGPGGGRNIGDIEEQQEQPGGSEEVADEPTGGDDPTGRPVLPDRTRRDIRRFDTVIGAGAGGIETGRTQRGNDVTQDLQRQARGFERDLIREDPNVRRAADVDIGFRDSSLTAEFTDRARFRGQSIQRDRAIGEFREQGIDIAPGDVSVSDGRATLTEDAQERIATEQVQEQAGRQEFTDVPEGTPPGIQRVVGREAGNLSADDARELSDLERGRDFTVDASGDEVDVQFTEGYFERQLTEQLDIAAEAGEDEDFTIEETAEGGQRVQLTAEGRQDAITSQLLSRGEIEVDRPSATIGTGTANEFGIRGSRGEGGELLGPGEREDIVIGGGTQAIEIESAEQLEFDEEGNLTNVTQPPLPTFEEEVEQIERTQTPIGEFGTASAVGLAGSRQLLRGAGDISTDVGAGFGRRVVDPAADVAGDVVGLLGEGVEIAIEGGGRFGEQQAEAFREQQEDIETGARDLLRAPEDEVGEPTAAEEVTEEFTTGVGGIVRAGIELPETVRVGADLAGRAGAFTTEEVVEEGIVEGGSTAVTAGGQAAVEAGEQIAVQTINEPVRTTGMLVGSAGIFGAARAVGPRASLGTRAAIQPGEELLGYGGAGLFRRLPGERTTRAGQLLFPQNEPLIFSEEAAIRGAQRVGGAARRVGQNVRTGLGYRALEARAAGGRVRSRLAQEIGEFRADTEAQLVPDGGQRLEARQETEGEQEAELGPELEPFDVSDTRLYDPAREFGEQRGFRRVDPTGETEFDQDIGEGIAGRGDPEPAPGRSGFGLPAEVAVEVRQRIRAAETPSIFQQRVGLETRGQGVSTRYRAESESEDILEQAQRPEVRIEETELSGIEDTSLIGETEAESDLQQQAFRTELDVDEDEALAFEPVFEGAFDAEQPLEGELEQELEFEQELELEQEAEMESELEQELESEFESEFETESEQELEQEMETEFEQELEQELEVEIEIEQEIERELEVEPFPYEQDDDDDEFAWGFAADDEFFGTGILSAGDVSEEDSLF